jgi:hypothetical protein
MIEYSKIEIAVEYLDAAIDEWEIHGRYFAAMNLAGVSEELLGKVLRAKGEKDRLTAAVEDLTYVQDKLWDKLAWAKKSHQEYKKLLGSTKNAIKHMDSASDVNARLYFEVEDESKWLIQSAIHNLGALGIRRSKRIEAFSAKFSEDELPE